MQVIKLPRGSKISERVQTPIESDKRTSDIQYARKRKKAIELYGELESSQSKYDKEAEEYVKALNEINEEFGYESQYSIDFDKE